MHEQLIPLYILSGLCGLYTLAGIARYYWEQSLTNQEDTNAE